MFISNQNLVFDMWGLGQTDLCGSPTPDSWFIGRSKTMSNRRERNTERLWERRHNKRSSGWSPAVQVEGHWGTNSREQQQPSEDSIGDRQLSINCQNLSSNEFILCDSKEDRADEEGNERRSGKSQEPHWLRRSIGNEGVMHATSLYFVDLKLGFCTNEGENYS